MLTKIRFIPIMILILLLAGCATTQNYQTILASWQGADINELISQWGIPDNSYQLPNGDTVYIYQSERQLRYPSQYIPGSTATTSSSGNTTVTSYPGLFVPGETFDLNCTTIFTVNDKYKITLISYKGNSCFASEAQLERLSNSK